MRGRLSSFRAPFGPGAVILTRHTSIALSPALITSRRVAASPARTRPASAGIEPFAGHSVLLNRGPSVAPPIHPTDEPARKPRPSAGAFVSSLQRVIERRLGV